MYSVVDIPLIFDLKARVELIQTELKKEVHTTFKELGQIVDSVADVNVLIQGANKSSTMRSLPDACLVVDALGE